MKVCLYSENLNLIAKSGLGRSIKHQTKALQSAGIEVTRNYLEDYDVLLINTVGLKSKKVIKIAKKKNAKIIYYGHTTYEDFKDSFIFSNQIAFFYKKWITRLYKKADYILVPNHHNKKLIQQYHPQMPPIFQISNGVDFEGFNNPKKRQENIAAFENYFKIKPKDKVVIGAGFLIKRKGLNDFIKAAKRFPKYRFIWFGHTSVFLRQIKMNFKLLFTSLDNLEFPGFVEGSIFHGALASANLFFFPSYEEGEGIAILEALASNQTCLIRDIGAYKGWLKSGINCYKFNGEEKMYKTIYNVLEKKIPSLKKQPLNVAKQKSLHLVGQKYLAFLTKILD